MYRKCDAMNRGWQSVTDVGFTTSVPKANPRLRFDPV